MSRNVLFGPILILLGVLMFSRGGAVHWDTGSVFAYFWPSMFVLPLGVFFHWLYFSLLQQRGVGVLVPGGILLTAGLVCQVAMLFDSWSFMWPGFIFAVAVGLFELYWFGSRNKWLLIPINILTVLSVLFFAIFSIGALFSSLLNGRPILALALIAAGGFVMLFGRKRSF
ncbi:hypothetical protein [Cohnella sp. REN36]|uniref:hypothetical protein n=1 Tax=Cohnella sp. REN36 TaxID=2887347 RepID=UPI001D13634C|nr:hypothetical protein [Cohnella sp. REN36]MCC3372722.1 hypothetical protein [Cohnella sp. REN36]